MMNYMRHFRNRISIFLSFILLLVVFSFFGLHSSRAQTNPTPTNAVLVQQSEKYVCLSAVVCGGPPLSARVGGPSPTPATAKCKLTDASQAHTVLLRAKIIG